MSSEKVDRKIDTYIDNIIKTNYNGFASNNNNPFLVSPYAPTANAGIITQINELNSTICTLNENISSLFDLSTMTMRICTITNTLSGNSVTISTANFIVDATSVYINSNDTNVSTLNASTITFRTLTGSTINTSTLNTSVLNYSTLTGSTINTSTMTTSKLNFSTLIGSSISANSLSVNLTISTNNIVSYGIIESNEFNGNFITIGTSINTPYINISEGIILNVDTISTGFVTFDTLGGSIITTSTINTTLMDFNIIRGPIISTNTISTNIITTNELIFSSLCMIPSTISSFPVNGFSSSILICLNGSYWKIPIFPV